MRKQLDKYPEYSSWLNMKNRCLNKNSHSYKNYGAKGIRICDSWRNSFEVFLKDMGRRPAPKYQIDRINNNGNYEPSNCRWVTASVNVRNSRKSKLDVFKVRDIRTRITKGESRKAIALEYGVSKGCLESLINNRSWKDVTIEREIA